MNLSEKDKQEIEYLIKEVEQKSEAEIVAAISQKSKEYNFSWFFCFFVFLITFFLIFFSSFSKFEIFYMQVILMCFFYILSTFFADKLIAFLPRSYKKRCTFEYAKESFFKLGLDKTSSHIGLMFFVSVDEKYAHIIADKGIKEKIPDEQWQGVLDRFILHVKKDEFATAFKEAIKECSSVLIEQFPIKDDDKNELPDKVVSL